MHAPPPVLRLLERKTLRGGFCLVLCSLLSISSQNKRLFCACWIVPPQREMSEAEKQREVERAAARIRSQTQQRSEKLKREAHLSHLDHELKFGKLMLSQVSVVLYD